MTLENIANSSDAIACFNCGAGYEAFPKGKLVALCDANEIIVIRNQRTFSDQPMVFCSSSCLIADCHARWIQSDSKRQERQYGNRIPNNFATDDRMSLVH